MWFDSADSRTPDQVGAAFVDVFLGGLLLERLALSEWANPSADVSVVREIPCRNTGCDRLNRAATECLARVVSWPVVDSHM